MDSKENTTPCAIKPGVTNNQKLCRPVLPNSNIPKIWDCESCKYIDLADSDKSKEIEKNLGELRDKTKKGTASAPARLETETFKQEKPFSLEEFRGKMVFVFFYQGDFKPGSQEMIENLGKISSSSSLMKDAQIVAISTDKVKTHKDFSRMLNWGEEKMDTVNILLVSDQNGYISRKFGVLQTKTHTALMSLFIVGPDGILKGSRVWGKDLQPTAVELKEILTQYIQSEDVQESISGGNSDENMKSILAQGGGIVGKSKSVTKDCQETLVKDENSATIKNNEEIETMETQSQEEITKISQIKGWPIPRLDKIKSSQEIKNGGVNSKVK